MDHTATSARRPNANGEQTRQRLIVAALALFGDRGLEGVGAREIAAAAGVPLAAIPYHFGTKEALYRATLEQVRERLAEAIAPAAALAHAALEQGPEEARAALAALQGALLDIIAGRPEAESWARLLIREHFDPGSGFELVYEDAARGAIDLMAALIARATGRAAEDPAVLIEAFARMGEVLVFRVTRHAILRRLGWEDLGERERSAVRETLGWS